MLTTTLNCICHVIQNFAMSCQLQTRFSSDVPCKESLTSRMRDLYKIKLHKTVPPSSKREFYSFVKEGFPKGEDIIFFQLETSVQIRVEIF